MPLVFPGLADEVGAICSEFGLRDVYTGMTNVYNQAMVEPFRKMQSAPLPISSGAGKNAHKVGTSLFSVINGLNHPSICPTSKCQHPSFVNSQEKNRMCTELGIVTCNQGANLGRDAKSAAKVNSRYSFFNTGVKLRYAFSFNVIYVQSDDGEKTMCALRGLNPYTSEKTVPDGQQPTLALQVNHPIPFFKSG